MGRIVKTVVGEHPPMAGIVLATDGSEYADTAAREAIALAREHDTTLHVICVVDRRKYSEPTLSSAELTTIGAEDHADRCVATVAEMAGDDITVDGVARHGIPHETILDYAAELDADYIVVGEHGDHEKHFSGVGRRLTELSDRDVLVVPAGD
jgi:nucleotide-binding universal stress UspA family protein